MEYVTGDPNQGNDSETSTAEAEQISGAPQASESQTVYSLADAADLVGQSKGVSVFQPNPGESVFIEAQSGSVYQLEFDLTLPETIIRDGALVFRFADGGELIFENIEELIAEGDAPGMLAGGLDVLSLLIGRGTIASTVLDQPAPGEIVVIDALLGQGDFLMAAMKKRRADVSFQIGDKPADGRLRHAEEFGPLW